MDFGGKGFLHINGKSVLKQKNFQKHFMLDENNAQKAKKSLDCSKTCDFNFCCFFK